MAERSLSRSFFLILLLGTTFAFFWMMKEFVVPVLLGAVFASLFYPLFRWFLRLLRGRRNLAAFLCCFVLLLVLVVPLYLVAYMVTNEAIDFYSSTKVQVAEILRQGDAGPLGKLKNLSWVRQFHLEQVDWKATVKDAAATVGSGVATVIKSVVDKTSRGTIQVVVTLFITLFTLFYFFRDGEGMVARARALVPLDDEYKDAILERFSSVSRATVRGTLLIALVQGACSGLALWAFGVGSPFLWGVVATLTSIVPLVGAWVVLYPAAFYLMATGHLWPGVGLLLVTMVVIVNVDNLLRPRLVGQEAGMHDLMVFFATLGGIGLFGPMGFILGPMLAALFLSMLDIYGQEFKADLGGDPGPAVTEDAPGLLSSDGASPASPVEAGAPPAGASQAG